VTSYVAQTCIMTELYNVKKLILVPKTTVLCITYKQVFNKLTN
jgi:hypothetical protein